MATGVCTKYPDEQEGSFRTPSLINVAMTGPYFHTGLYNTLRDVVQHYNQGGAPAGTFAGTKSPRIRPLGLTDPEVDDLVEFLKTLTGDLPDVDWSCDPSLPTLPDGQKSVSMGACAASAQDVAGPSGLRAPPIDDARTRDGPGVFVFARACAGFAGKGVPGGHWTPNAPFASFSFPVCGCGAGSCWCSRCSLLGCDLKSTGIAGPGTECRINADCTGGKVCISGICAAAADRRGRRTLRRHP